MLPTDIEVTGASLTPVTRMFPPPDAKVVHVYRHRFGQRSRSIGGAEMIRSITLLSLIVAVSPTAWSQAKIVAVVNAASFQPGLPYGGALATAYVSGLVGLKTGTYLAPSSQPLPYSLGGIGVKVNGALAPLLAVVVPSDPSANVQVNFQVPAERNPLVNGFTAGGKFTINEATWPPAGQLSVPEVPVWGGFFADANGYAVALHASDSSLVTQQHPAHPGESIIVYGDDFFFTWPPPPISVPPPQQSRFQILDASPHLPAYLYLQTYPQPSSCVTPSGSFCSPSATNTPALQVTFQGLASSAVGVEEIHFVVPTNQQPGNWPLFFNSGSCPDGSGVPGTCGATGGSSSPYVLLPVD